MSLRFLFASLRHPPLLFRASSSCYGKGSYASPFRWPWERSFSDKGKGDGSKAMDGALHLLLKEMEISLQEPDLLSGKLTKAFRRRKIKTAKRGRSQSSAAIGRPDEDQMKQVVEDVAEIVGHGDRLKTKSDLMDRLTSAFEEKKVPSGESERLLDLLNDIEFERITDAEPVSTGRKHFRASSQLYVSDINLSPGGERLNIFDKNIAKEQKSSSEMLVWQELQQLQVKRASQLPPRNGFEEMIQWTKEGKQYPYPVDNGYLWFENSHNFHEHVFLEPYVENKIPKEGPIRRFMELVMNGLSTNPNMSVQKKREHLDWFIDYFQKKEADIQRFYAKETGTSPKQRSGFVQQ